METPYATKAVPNTFTVTVPTETPSIDLDHIIRYLKSITDGPTFSSDDQNVWTHGCHGWNGIMGISIHKFGDAIEMNVRSVNNRTAISQVNEFLTAAWAVD